MSHAVVGTFHHLFASRAVVQTEALRCVPIGRSMCSGMHIILQKLQI